MIVTLCGACDNVHWGGVDVALVPPPPKGEPQALPGDTGAAATLEPLPRGPVLYFVRQEGTDGVMVPIGEISGDTLRAIRPPEDFKRFDNRYIAEFLRQDAEFTLFHYGVRVGTFVVQSAAAPPEGVCPAVPVARGSLELSARADSVVEFLAMAKREAPESWRLPVDINTSRRMQVLGPILAERLLRARHSQLPGNWQFAMKQIFPFPLEGMPAPGFTGSLVVGDELKVGGDDTGFSLLFVATPNTQAGYDTVYARYVDYQEEGKQATRSIDFLDWDRDGQVEILLQNYGPQTTWLSALGTVGDEWRPIYDGRCGNGGMLARMGQTPADSAAADTLVGSRH